MNKLIIGTTAIFFSLIVLASCDKDDMIVALNSETEETIIPAEILQSPFPDREAEEMALWFTGDRLADSTTYKRFHYGLTQLREKFSWVNESGYNFQPLIISGYLEMRFEWNQLTQLRNGEYNDWYDIELELEGFRDIEFSAHPSHDNLVKITFNKIYNPTAIQGFFYKYRGIYEVSTAPNYKNQHLSYPPTSCIIIPLITENDEVAFLLDQSYPRFGQHQNEIRYHYFKEIAENLEYIGNYDDRISDTIPDWWAEIESALKKYRE